MAGQYIGVSNVARKVKTQFVGVSNVARKVTNGYLGVSNVAKKFFTGEYTVTIKRSGSYTTSTYANYAKVTVNGTTYNVSNLASTVTLSVPEGTVINCSASYESASSAGDWYSAGSTIYLNGTSVATGSYNYTVNSNVTFEVTATHNTGSSGDIYWGVIQGYVYIKT